MPLTPLPARRGERQATAGAEAEREDEAAALAVLLSAAGLSGPGEACRASVALEVCLQPLPSLASSLRHFSNLAELSLVDVGLRRLPTCPPLGASCPQLQRLWLPGNALSGAFPSPSSSPSPLSGLTQLTSLCVRQNRLTRLDARALARDTPALASLSLGGNRLRALDGLSALTALTGLQAPGNALAVVATAAAASLPSSSSSSIPSLRVLNLAGNPSPSSLRELHSLAASFPALEELWLVDPLWPSPTTTSGGAAGSSDDNGVGGCPAAALGGYSSAALAALPASLRRLDGLPVSETAREAAVEARRRGRLGRDLLRRELERRVLLPRQLLVAGAPTTAAAVTLLRAKRALARALRRFELAGETHGSVRVEEAGLDEDGGEEEGSSLLLRLLSPPLSRPPSPGAAPTPALFNLRVWSAAHVHSRARALAFEAGLRRRLLPAGTAYLGPGTPAVAAAAARGGVLPAALAADGGRHVRTLFYVLPGRGGSYEHINSDDDDDDQDGDMQALEAIAELGFAGAAAVAAATGGPLPSPCCGSSWVRLLKSPPSRSRGRRLAVMVVRAYVGAEGPGGHVRLQAAQGQQGGGGAKSPPAALLADLPASAVAAVVQPSESSSRGGGGDKDEVWWHRDPELVLPVGILELSAAAGDEGGGHRLAVVAAGSASSIPEPALPRAVPSARSLQVATSAFRRALEGARNLAGSSSAETASALLLPPPQPPSLPTLSPLLLSLDLGSSGLSGPCPELWRALGRVSMLTHLELGGNAITALCGEEDEEEEAATTSRYCRRRPLLPALCVLGLESNALGSLRGLDRLAGSALAQLHARDNPRLASPADALGPLTAPVVLVPAAGSGAEEDGEEGDDADRLTAHFLPHSFPRLEVLDLRGSALASGEGVPQSLLCAREQQQQEQARQRQQQQEPAHPSPPLTPAELRARDYRLYALHLLLRGSASCLASSCSRGGTQPQSPPLLVLDGQAVCPRERARAALAYGGLLTREALAGLTAAAAGEENVVFERLSLRGWRLNSTGAVFSSSGDDKPPKPPPALPVLPPPSPPLPPRASSTWTCPPTR